MKKYNWFQKIGLSLVPGEFYFHILEEKISRAIGYMLLFILVLSLGVGIYTGSNQKSSIELTLADYESGIIPPISLSKGQLSIEGENYVVIPYFDTMVILDDGHYYDISEAMAYKNLMYFQKDSLSVIANGQGPISYDYPNSSLFSYTSDDLLVILKVASASAIPSAIIAQFLLAIISFLLNSVFVLMMANISRTMSGLKLKLGQVYHMVIYAMTFSVFWTHFTTLLPARVPLWLDNFVYFAIPSLILINVYLMMRKKALEKL